MFENHYFQELPSDELNDEPNLGRPDPFPQVNVKFLAQGLGCKAAETLEQDTINSFTSRVYPTKSTSLRLTPMQLILPEEAGHVSRRSFVFDPLSTTNTPVMMAYGHRQFKRPGDRHREFLRIEQIYRSIGAAAGANGRSVFDGFLKSDVPPEAEEFVRQTNETFGPVVSTIPSREWLARKGKRTETARARAAEEERVRRQADKTAAEEKEYQEKQNEPTDDELWHTFINFDHAKGSMVTTKHKEDKLLDVEMEEVQNSNKKGDDSCEDWPTEAEKETREVPDQSVSFEANRDNFDVPVVPFDFMDAYNG